MRKDGVVGIAVMAGALLAPATAFGHGTMGEPVSRVLACYQEGPERPVSAACRAAWEVGGPQPFYDWNEVNLPDPAGRHRELVPDGKLCSAGRAKYAGLDLARSDWRRTALPSGRPFTFRYPATAPHVGSFELHVTKEGWSPTQGLRWSDLEPTPFLRATNPPLSGGAYHIAGATPAGRSGTALIYAIWQRSDSPEAFYSCSDVLFERSDQPADTTAPTTPADLRASDTTASTITLAWSPSTDDVAVTAYDLLRDGQVVATTSTTTATLRGLEADTQHRLAVRARDAAGNASAASPAIDVRTRPAPNGDTTPPSTPGGLHVMGVTSSTVELMWSAASDDVGVTGYEVLRDGAVVASTSGATAATVRDLPPDTDLPFAVRARDAAGNRSAPSAVVRTHTAPDPAPPQPATTCATFATTSAWSGGYVGQVTVRNTGATAVDGWRVELDLPLSASITGSWSAQVTRVGTQVVATPEPWTRTIAVGRSVAFGFQVEGDARPALPTCA